MEFLDITTLSSLQNDLSRVTGLYLSFYDEKGNIVLPPTSENKFFSLIKSSSKWSDEYDAFVKNNVEKTLYRNDISLLKGPEGQCHFFIPLRVDGFSLLIVGGGVFLSRDDLENFCRKKGPAYGFLPYRLKPMSQEVSVRNPSDIQDIAGRVRSIFSLLLQSSYRENFFEKKYRLIKTVLSLISDIRLENQEEEICNILVDIVLFLFNADSASIMRRDGDTFKTRMSAGRLKDNLRSTEFTVTGILSELVEKRSPVYTESALDMARLGLNGKVTSFCSFPVVADDRVMGLLNIFNSRMQGEDEEILSTICRIMGCFFHLAELKCGHERCLKEIDVLNDATTRLLPVKEPDILYETILDTSVHLADAEKGSLMLVDEDASCLTVRAAKGINKRFFPEIKIRSGEGIAGRVFREGVPLMVDDIGKNELGFIRRPKYRTGSFISIPLRIGEKTIGVLNLSDKIQGGTFSEEDMFLLRSFASYASIALERTSYYSLAGQLKELSITDPMTGLFNRRYFEERFLEELHRSRRHALSFSLAMLDIDDFKLFNDAEGHLAGDEMLKCISKIAKDSLRVTDVIARFGGEEFAVIMPQTEADEAFLVAERIRNSVKEHLPAAWGELINRKMTLSIGVATFPSCGADRKELIRNADKALYMAKMEGKDRTLAWKG